MADWFKRCRIKTVVMESTGVYWIPIYEILESRGFKVHLVNARHVKYLPGRKSDVLDCQWLQQLMRFGLLRGAFRPNEQICALRALWRHRDTLLSDQGRHVQRMQKVLTQMNVQLHNVTVHKQVHDKLPDLHKNPETTARVYDRNKVVKRDSI